MEAAAVIIHYHTPDAVPRCLAALQRQASLSSIVLIDNSAPEAQLAPLTSVIPCRIVESSANLGFAAACNLGAKLTQEPLVLFLNADVQLREGSLQALRAAMATSERRGLIGPRIWDADHRVELSARAFPDWRTGILGRTSRLSTTLIRHGRPPAALSAAHGNSRQVDWVSGACQLMRRAAFDAVGGFDENYWLYWEDADLCWRLREAGFEVWFDPTAEVDHITGSSGRNPRTIQAFHDSASRFYEQHLAHGRWDSHLVKRALGIRARLQIAGKAR